MIDAPFATLPQMLVLLSHGCQVVGPLASIKCNANKMPAKKRTQLICGLLAIGWKTGQCKSNQFSQQHSIYGSSFGLV